MPDYPEPKSIEHLERILATFTDYEKMAAFHSGAIRCDLVMMRRLAAALHQPQDRVPCVHIAGSKGKGSTAIQASALLESAGIRCGLYTSPHLVHLRERIAVDRRPLDDGLFLAAAERVLAALRRDSSIRPTFFEFMTAAAMEAFAAAGAGAAVYEVGLGGRLDATNIIAPAVSVVTNIELEHVPRLGRTIAEIAREKAGIIKPGVPVATLIEKDSPARPVVERRAAEMNAPLFAPGSGLELIASGRGCRVRILGELSEEFVPPRPAAVQARNAALALAAVRLFQRSGAVRFPSAPDVSVLSRTPLPGRFEMLGGRPLVIVDGAHSRASIEAAAGEARVLAGGRRLVVLFGLASDKDLPACLAPVERHADEIVFARYQSPRSSDPAAMLAAAGGRGRAAPSVAAGLAGARAAAGPDGVVLVTGSFYLAGEARTLAAPPAEFPAPPAGAFQNPAGGSEAEDH